MVDKQNTLTPATLRPNGRGSLSVSVVIPTYNRPLSVRGALESILAQTKLPLEVIVVGESCPTDPTERVVASLAEAFTGKSVHLTYMRNHRQRSLTAARNVGVQNSTGDIVLFLDDDVLLHERYVEALVEVYDLQPDAKGVQGFWINEQMDSSVKFRFLNSLNKLFFLMFYEKNRCRVLPSFSHTYPHTLTQVVTCDWLSGCNQSYIRSVFSQLEFDEKLMRYSPGEDVDFSYGVHKKYPNCLFITPYARLTHLVNQTARMPSTKLIYVQAIYSYYLFSKNIKQSPANRLVYMWSRLGHFLTYLSPWHLTGQTEQTGSKVAGIYESIRAQMLCFRNRSRIRRGDLSASNEYLN